MKNLKNLFKKQGKLIQYAVILLIIILAIIKIEQVLYQMLLPFWFIFANVLIFVLTLFVIRILKAKELHNAIDEREEEIIALRKAQEEFENNNKK